MTQIGPFTSIKTLQRYFVFKVDLAKILMSISNIFKKVSKIWAYKLRILKKILEYLKDIQKF